MPAFYEPTALICKSLCLVRFAESMFAWSLWSWSPFLSGQGLRWGGGVYGGGVYLFSCTALAVAHARIAMRRVFDTQHQRLIQKYNQTIDHAQE